MYHKRHARTVRFFLGVALLTLFPVSMVLARIPNDSFFGDQWYLRRIGSIAAWDVGVGGDDVVIAVLDTGVDLDHADLVGNLWKNEKEIPGNGKDDDKNGFIDDYDGWDFVDRDSNPEPEEAATPDSGAISHGTFIAGLIGAQANNEVGYAGVMWDASIMPLRVLNENGAGSEEQTASAIDYAVAQGVDVINMSFAGSSAGSRLRTSVRKAYEAGVVVVAALGNEGKDVDRSPVYPACLHSEIDDWVLGIAATDADDKETEFTNYGASCADLSAPGEDMLGLGYQMLAQDYAYSGPWSGTSAASPLVAGAAGLVLSQHPGLSPAQVATILKLSVDPITSTISGAGAIGVGRLNIARALEIAPSFAPEQSTVVPGETPKPSAPTADEHFDDFAKYSFVALGAPRGSAPDVQVYRADRTSYATFAAYAPSFTGGVRVAVEDMDGDAVPEIVTGAGVGGGPHVRIFKPYGALINEFFAYDQVSNQGVNVAIGDVDADGYDDIVTAVGARVSDDIVVWSQQGVELSRFTATGFAPDASLAVVVADVDSDWEKEIVVFAETGESRVAIYNADGTHVVDFDAFPGDANGVRVAVGDLDSDYRDEIVAVGGVGASAAVRVYNKIGAYWGGFAAPQADGIYLSVDVADIDVNGESDIVIAPRNGAGNVSVHSLTGDLLKSVGENLVGAAGAYLGAW